MNSKKFVEAKCGKFVCQLPRAKTFTYDLCLGHSRDHWKGLAKDHNSEKVKKYYFSYSVP